MKINAAHSAVYDRILFRISHFDELVSCDSHAKPLTLEVK